MKLKELIEMFNNDLKSLEGVKIKNANQFQELKHDVLLKNAKKFNFNITNWFLQLELRNKNTFKQDVDVFEIKLSLKQDERYKYGMAGTIEKIEVVLIDNMKDYADIDLEQLDSVYLVDCIKRAIEEHQEVIKQKIQELYKEQELLTKYQEEYEKVKKEVLLSDL